MFRGGTKAPPYMCFLYTAVGRWLSRRRSPVGVDAHIDPIDMFRPPVWDNASTPHIPL